MMKASVFENVSRFGKSSIEKDNWMICFKDAFEAAPMPLLIAYKAASSMSYSFPEIPCAPTACALRWLEVHDWKIPPIF